MDDQRRHPVSRADFSKGSSGIGSESEKKGLSKQTCFNFIVFRKFI